MTYLIRILVGAILTLTLLSPAQAQIPDEFTNLQVLDDDISKMELIGMMRGFAGALGVRCNFCHPGGEGDSLEGVDFATDDMEHKRVAREMMKMTHAINNTYVAQATGDDDATQVRCVTCHRGQAHPDLIGDVLEKAKADGGVEAVREKYNSLREEYYGSHTFDFRESVLNGLAESMMRSGEMEAGKEIIEFNLSFYPESSYTHIMLAQALHQMGDTEGSIAALEKAVELDPENTWAQRMLERAKASGDED